MDRADIAVEQWGRERPDLPALPIAIFGRLPDATERVTRDHMNPLFAEAGLQPGEFDVLATRGAAAIGTDQGRAKDLQRTAQEADRRAIGLRRYFLVETESAWMAIMTIREQGKLRNRLMVAMILGAIAGEATCIHPQVLRLRRSGLKFDRE